MVAECLGHVGRSSHHENFASPVMFAPRYDKVLVGIRAWAEAIVKSVPDPDSNGRMLLAKAAARSFGYMAVLRLAKPSAHRPYCAGWASLP